MVTTVRNVVVAGFALVILVALLVLVFWVALWLAIVAAIIIAIALLNLVLLPRIATRIGLSTQVLTLFLLPAVVALGWIVAGKSLGGVVAGFVVWLSAVALPRLALRSARTRASAKIEFRIGQPQKASTGADPRPVDLRVVKPPSDL